MTMDREKRRASWRAYDARHRAERAAAARAYSRTHREQINARDRADWKAGDAAKRRAIARYRAANPEKARAVVRAWAATHGAERLALEHRRRARKLGNGGSHTAQEWRDKVTLLGGCCIYCGRNDAPLQRDHKVPIVRGGTDDISNLVPACAECNTRKGSRTAQEFIALRMAAAA